MADLGQKIKQQSAERQKKQRFLTWRMWADTLVSMFRSDRGIIPKDIGDDILMTNNLLVASKYMTAVILIEEYGMDTPLALISKLNRYVKSRVPEVLIDCNIKTDRYEPDPKDWGIMSRERAWQRTLNNPLATQRQQESAARCLATLDIVRSGAKLVKARTFILLRSQTNYRLKQAIAATQDFFGQNKISYKHLKTNVGSVLPYILECANEKVAAYKDLAFTVYSSQTLAETLPITQGVSSELGVLFGIDQRNNAPYYVNFKTSAKAKNVYVIARSGEGKTFLVLFWLLSFYNQGFNVCVMDLKGNEFAPFINSCNGKVVSMRPEATSYVNTFRLDIKKVRANNEGYIGRSEYAAYYREQLGVSKRFLYIIIDPPEHLRVKAEAFIEEFLSAVYLQLGVTDDNPKTWKRADKLTPFSIYGYFLKYLSPDVEEVYASLMDSIKMGFSTYINPKGQMSDLFRAEYSMGEILDAKAISFDYGILNNKRLDNPIAFKLKVLFMSLINDEYIMHKKSKGEWTVKVLEESQIADDYLLRVYKDELTLRRAQNQITLLLGNSVASLKDNPVARAIFENINILAVGKVNDSSRQILVNEFGLDKYEKDLDNISDNPEYERCFLFVNQALRSTTAILKAEVPQDVVDGKLFRVVDTEQ